MITLPTVPAVRHQEVEPIDTGFTQRAVSGAALRIDRPGSRLRLHFEFPPMDPASARVFEVRLQQARSGGLRHPVSLIGGSQGLPGATVVNGTDSGGTVLKVTGGNPGYVVREGYWLNVIHAGLRYLHRVTAAATLNGSGAATLAVEPPLRIFPSNGDSVELAAPVIEGECSFERFVHPVNRRITLAMTIEESA